MKLLALENSAENKGHLEFGPKFGEIPQSAPNSASARARKAWRSLRFWAPALGPPRTPRACRLRGASTTSSSTFSPTWTPLDPDPSRLVVTLAFGGRTLGRGRRGSASVLRFPSASALELTLAAGYTEYSCLCEANFSPARCPGWNRLDGESMGILSLGIQ